MIGVMSAVNELLETVVGLLSLPKKPCRAHVHINASYRQLQAAYHSLPAIWNSPQETVLSDDSVAVFTARCYASEVLAMGLCPCLCLSVCHKPVFY